MNRKIDRRNINTKITIANTFKDLVKKQPINKITISMITKSSGFNRNTFYYHFVDIYDLIEWTYKYDVDNLLKKSNIYNIEGLLIKAFEYMENNKDIIKSTYNYLGNDMLKKIMHPYFYNTVSKIFDENLKEIRLLDKNFKEFMIEFYSDGVASSIMNYINNQNDLDKDTTIKYLLTMNNFIISFFKNEKELYENI